MSLSIFVGDIADAEADALCTSTNPRLTLVMGTGAAVRARGGFAILRACEAIVSRAGGHLPAGSVHPTVAGDLPHKVILHCVASDGAHRSSPQIIAACVHNALAAAHAAGCRSIAMPVFGTGHARVRFAEALRTIVDAVANDPLSITLVIKGPDRAEEAGTLLGRHIPITYSSVDEPAAATLWSAYDD